MVASQPATDARPPHGQLLLGPPAPTKEQLHS